MTPILAFDIETVPDVNGIRLLYDLPASLPDDEVVLFAQQKRRAQNGSDFMQHHLHQVVAISCCMRWGQDKIRILFEVTDDQLITLAVCLAQIEQNGSEVAAVRAQAKRIGNIPAVMDGCVYGCIVKLVS